MSSDNSSAHLASRYDSDVRATIPYYDQIHDETIRLVRASGAKTSTWLDTGCGTGTLVEKARKAFPETQFLLADPSDEMIRETRKKCGEDPSLRVMEPVSTQDIKNDKPVDVITAIQCHHYLDKNARIAAVQKCYELLVPDGLFVTSENVRPTSQKGIEIGLSYWKDFQVSAGRDEKSVFDHLKRFDKEYFPITVEDHFFLYRLCGFRVVELFWYSYLQAGFYCIK